MVSGERTNITRLPPETVSSQACTAARRMEGRSGTEFKTDDRYKVTQECVVPVRRAEVILEPQTEEKLRHVTSQRPVRHR